MGLILLIVLAVYILLSIGLAVGAQYLGKRKGWKWCNWWVIVIVMALIPTWDIPVGKVYFYYLCSTSNDAGIHVYKKVELSKEYFLPKGKRDKRYVNWSPYAYSDGNALDNGKLKSRYSVDTRIDKSDLWGVRRKITMVREKKTNELLSTAISFYYVGGWVVRAMSDPLIIYANIPEYPSPVSGTKYIHDEVLDRTFVKK